MEPDRRAGCRRLRGAAHAASITVTSDAMYYAPGETITLTVVYDSEGEAAASVQAELRFDPALVSFQTASVETAASFGGSLPWTVGGTQGTVHDQLGGDGIGDTLTAINQLGGLNGLQWSDTTGDAAAVVGTYQFTLDAEGVALFSWTNVDFFSADETSPNVTGVAVIIPEPTTAALLGLGLVGLGLRGSRRAARRLPGRAPPA